MCRLFGHSWRLFSERWVHENRHDLGRIQRWYCVRCRTEEDRRR